MPEITNDIDRDQNDTPTRQPSQNPAPQAPDTSQSYRDGLSEEDIQFLTDIQAPGFCQGRQNSNNDSNAQQPGDDQTSNVTPAGQSNSLVPAAQGPGTSLPPNYLDHGQIPKRTLQQAQFLGIEGKSLLDVFNGILYQYFNFLTDDVRYDVSDIGAGNLMADVFRDQLRYVPERKCWHQYNGKKWKPDDGAAMELCKTLAQILETLWGAVKPTHKKKNEQRSKALGSFFAKWQTRRGRETILKDAQTVWPVKMEEFDKDPYILNCLNGTLHMRDWRFYPHRPDDLLTKMANVVCDSTAWSDRWVKHIDEVMMGDQDKILFLQQALGYALTGATNHECFFILYGPTSRNGKGVTMETFATLMGDYARSARPETITQKQTTNGSAPNEDVARLAGSRFINISEPDKKMVLDSALVKTLTGNDTISARFLHENSFEFRLTGKLFINTNHLPSVTDATVFNSDRVKVIPFERHFEPHERDKNLKAYLTEPKNLSGILNWCLVGLQSLQQNGFVDSPSVQLATEDYQQDSDKMNAFISDMLEESPGSELFTEAAYGAYKTWCDTNGYRYGSQATFKRDMASRAQIKRKRPAGQPSANARSMIIGFRLKPTHQPMNQIPPGYHIATDEDEV